MGCSPHSGRIVAALFLWDEKIPFSEYRANGLLVNQVFPWLEVK
jgi:hypothetical protein